jgi:DNA-binding MarR family transcriptional regulator
MQRAELVCRRRDPDDARAGVVSLTASGRLRYARCHEKLTAVMGSLEHALEPGERTELRRLLTKFTAAIDAAAERSGAATADDPGVPEC